MLARCWSWNSPCEAGDTGPAGAVGKSVREAHSQALPRQGWGVGGQSPLGRPQAWGAQLLTEEEQHVGCLFGGPSLLYCHSWFLPQEDPAP